MDKSLDFDERNELEVMLEKAMDDEDATREFLTELIISRRAAAGTPPKDALWSECPRCFNGLYNGKECAICWGTGRITESLVTTASRASGTEGSEALDHEMRLALLRADKLAMVIDEQVQRGVMDARSAVADARLNYGHPHKYEWTPKALAASRSGETKHEK